MVSVILISIFRPITQSVAQRFCFEFNVTVEKFQESVKNRIKAWEKSIINYNEQIIKMNDVLTENG